MKKIKHYPVQYTLTQSMLDFFKIVTNDVALQKRLYQTETLFDAAEIAKEYGFDIPPSEIQKAQAGRVLGIINENNEDEIEALLNGDKPRTGAQWGRGGRGYLDRPGYWFLILHEQLACDHPDIKALLYEAAANSLLKTSLQNTQSVNDVIGILVEHDITISPTDWLAYYAQCILKANNELADQMTR